MYFGNLAITTLLAGSEKNEKLIAILALLIAIPLLVDAVPTVTVKINKTLKIRCRRRLFMYIGD